MRCLRLTVQYKKKEKRHMQNIKIIFFDIDGTLIAMDKDTISDKVLETLRRLQKKGSNFALQLEEDRCLSHILKELSLMHFLHTMGLIAMITVEHSIAIASPRKR